MTNTDPAYKSSPLKNDLFSLTRAPDSVLNLDVDGIELRVCDMVALEVYHGLKWLFIDYPDIVSIQPMWRPELDDDEFLVLFRLDVEMKIGPDISLDTCGYGDEPPFLASGPGRETFDMVVGQCESVYPGIWHWFKCFRVCQGRIYTNPQQLMEDMKSDLGPLVSELEAQAIGNRMAAENPGPEGHVVTGADEQTSEHHRPSRTPRRI